MKHLPALDGVRGLAILLVMWHHMTVLLPDSPSDHAFGMVANIGWIGVDLFFVLSGFLITSILYASRGSENYFIRFYWRRFLRIFPLYYMLVAFSLLVLPNIDHPKVANFSRIEGDELFYWTFLSNYSVAFAGAFRHAILDISWSLAIEEQFYLVWPWVVFACTKRRLLIVCSTLIGGATILRALAAIADVNSITAYVLTPLRVDSLAYGAAVALLLQDERGTAFLRAWVYRLALPAALVILYLWITNAFSYYEFTTRVVGFSAVSTAAACLIAHVVRCPNGALGRLFTIRLFRVFGIYSYALYLIHLPVRGAVRDALFRPESIPPIFGSHIPGQLVFYVTAMALSLGLAVMSWKFIEVPLLRHKDLVDRHRSSTAPTL